MRRWTDTARQIEDFGMQRHGTGRETLNTILSMPFSKDHRG